MVAGEPAGHRLAAFLPIALVAVIAACGLALMLFVFYPGVMTYDALSVYKAIAEGQVGDLQSPVMTALWAVIDPIAPGSGSMFLLTATLYWFGFSLVGITLARSSPRLGVVAVLLALTPPAFMLVGVIWRDMLFAGVWLCAAALVYAVAEARSNVYVPAQAVALALVALGVMLRPNALIAAPILTAYVLWPRRFAWTRVALAYVPAGLILYGLMHLVYYNVLGAVQRYPVHAIYVFDLGGITHFSKENQFPSTWSAAETTRLTSECYNPYWWDVYWYGGACSFVMERENEQRIFGTPVLSAAWRRALVNHPGDYLRHRAAFMRTFLFHANFTIWTQDTGDPTKLALPDNRGFVALVAVHDVLKSTPLFRVVVWLALCVIICAAAWKRRETPAGAFVVAVGASAVVYVLTFALVGVASNFRYAYWAVLAALAGIPTVLKVRRCAALGPRKLARENVKEDLEAFDSRVWQDQIDASAIEGRDRTIQI
jgi:hypothetical protein